ncbi:hypothetical protein GGS20DRAFT_132613 [Poronia punctata]|nr:hypothetical protein GGS20DRAFT_132613 [Poronia punctata]
MLSCPPTSLISCLSPSLLNFLFFSHSFSLLPFPFSRPFPPTPKITRRYESNWRTHQLALQFSTRSVVQPRCCWNPHQQIVPTCAAFLEWRDKKFVVLHRFRAFASRKRGCPLLFSLSHFGRLSYRLPCLYRISLLLPLFGSCRFKLRTPAPVFYYFCEPI